MDFQYIERMLLPNFTNSGFMPHIHCYLGNSLLVWTMGITDLLIGFAYVSISFTLWNLIRRIKLQFSFVIICFGAFIGACGATHFMEVWTLWHPDYWLAALVKVLTTVASVGTAVYLFRLRDVFIDFAESVRISDERKIEIEEYASKMEKRVIERTRELETLGSRLTRVSSASDLGIWYCDLPFGKLNWSNKTKEHFWLPEDEDVTINIFYEHIHPDDRDRTREAITASVEQKKSYDIEYRTVDPSNKNIWKWIRAVGWTAYDISGKAVSFDGITLDLTDKKKADFEKDQLQIDLSDLLERTTDGFCIVDSEWRMTYANPVTKKFLAIRDRPLIGQMIEDILPSPDRLKFMVHFSKIASTGESHRFEEVYEGRRLQVHAYKTRDGGIAIFHRDVTEQLEASDRLIESERRYATLTASIPQLVWTCLADGRCNYLSLQWEEYTGIPSSEQMDLRWLERVIHREDRKRTLLHWMGAVEGKHPYDIDYRIKRSDGEYRWFQARGTPLRDEIGRVLYWVGTCTDIHNQKILSQELNEAKIAAESANEAKSQFLANMSHEIRTPVGAITGFAEMLNHPEYSDTDRQSFAMIIKRNSRQLLRLIDDILDLSKVEAGKIAFENADFNFSDFLTDFDAVMSLRAAEKGIHFLMNVASEIPQHVHADQLRLKQILNNTAGNAIKFTDKGSVTADIFYDKDFLKISITDTGVGIAPNQIGNLFKPFSQADPSLTRKFGGTGLGLILSKRLANQFGGDLILEKSEYGKGSTFTVILQLPPALNAPLIDYTITLQVEATASPPPTGDGILNGITVLVVEDSPDNRTLISTYLRGTGVRLLLACEGHEGYTVAMKCLPDIVLMDIQMPKMDGHEATRKLRADGFLNPIIALTAHAMREERDRCLASGCSDYLTKPLRRDLLIKTIIKNAEAVLKRKELI